MTALRAQIEHIADATPSWLNWIGIVGTAALSWIQPVAGVVAIIWGCLQIYTWLEKRYNDNNRRNP
jgi:hypothetical protein